MIVLVQLILKINFRNFRKKIARYSNDRKNLSRDIKIFLKTDSNFAKRRGYKYKMRPWIESD